MKLWQSLMSFKVVMVAVNGWTQQVNSVGQLNKLRNLPEQLSQDLTEKPTLDPTNSPWAFYLGSGLTYTTNANLTSSGVTDDVYATGTLGVRRQATLGQGFALSSGLEVTDYRYERYPRLSVSFLDWDLMLSWSGTTSALQWQGYVSHTLEGTQQVFRAQSVSSIAALGGSVTRKIVPGHELSAAAEISVTPYTWPAANAYGCVYISASYNWKVTPGIALNHSIRGYETVYFMGRRDFTTSYTATLNWAVASWLSASIFASPNWNFSSQRGGDYSALDIGITVSGNWQF